MIVVPGPASKELGLNIADLLDVKAARLEFKTFPDGESYMRFEDDVKGEKVVIVQTTGPPQNTHLLQLFLMSDTVRDLGAKEVEAVVPYLAYARQDGRFSSGEVFSIKTVMTLLEACGVNRVITINSHNPKVLLGFRMPVKDLSAIGLLADYFVANGFGGAFSLSLGKQAIAVAKEASDVLGGGYDCVQTRRDRITGKVEVEKKSLPVKNKDAIIFDDIISSGGTMAKAVKEVKNQGARKVFAACVHPLLMGDASERISKSGADGMIGTNCLSSPISVVSVAPLIAQAIRENR